MKKERYVYVVCGLCHDYDGIAYPVFSNNHAVHTSMAKAQAELDNILNESQEEADLNGYTMISNRGDDWLDIEYETGTIEKYQIYRSKIN